MWKRIYISSDRIKAETRKSVLISMPSSSDFAGFSFWHPRKLVRPSVFSNDVSVSYTNDFVFRLKKYGKGKYNSREVIETREISASEFVLAFSDAGVNDPEPEEPEIYVPEHLEPEGAEADESLIDYD